jgi:RecB family exonuclease
MPHISFSALKDWNFCAWYHKLTRIDGIGGFEGNAYTAFGNAIHEVCEKKLLKEEVNEDDMFIRRFEHFLGELNEEQDEKLVGEMREQGKAILPEIEDALEDYFGEYEVLGSEIPLDEKIDDEDEYVFKGFIDGVVATPDGKVHIFDWKTCSWGWDAKRRNSPMTTYQLTLYKHYFARKMNIDPKSIETHFALLKRTSKKDRVEFFRVTSGPRKTENALKLLKKALYNIKNKRYIKNRLSCKFCAFNKTEHCR